jgi:hypothetical protein
LEELVDRYGNKVRVGYVNSGNENTELIRETYVVPGYPHICLLREGDAYTYLGDRSFASLRDFATGKHARYDKTSIP